MSSHFEPQELLHPKSHALGPPPAALRRLLRCLARLQGAPKGLVGAAARGPRPAAGKNKWLGGVEKQGKIYCAPAHLTQSRKGGDVVENR